MTDTLRPVAKSDRHLSLDTLRGLGVMGILAVNAIGFAQPLPVYVAPELSPFPLVGHEATAWWVVQTFFHYKFVTLFSMLFGVSILLVGGEGGDPARTGLLRRRLGWLAFFGLLHGMLIWFGDILLLYACVGFVVLRWRGWPPRKLFAVSLAVTLGGSVLAVAPYLAIENAPPAVQRDVLEQMGPPSDPADIPLAIAEMREGLVPATVHNIKDWAMLQAASLVIFSWRTGALMLLGMALFKSGFLTGRAPTAVYAALVALGAAGLAWSGWENTAKLATTFAKPESFGRYQLAYEFATLPITLGYASAAILLIRLSLVKRLCRPLACLGQMAFTNYLTQSLIMTTILWSGRGLGLYGQLDRVQLWGCVAAIWALQLIWSPLWLARFQMGPLEWVWRRLTYGRGLRA